MKFIPYSFSKISSHQTCPLKFKFDYIDKLGIFQKSKALEKGSFVHKWLENKGLGKDEKPSFKFTLSSKDEVKEYEEIYHKFCSSEIGHKYLDPQAIGVEIDFGVKYQNGKFTTTSYWDKSALFRGKIDHAFMLNDELWLIDWKTGKVNPWQNNLQIDMYALWGFLNYPNINTIRGAFVYVEHSEEKFITYKREDLSKLMKNVASVIRNIETDDTFEKKESPLCNYCAYREKGLCEPETGSEFASKFMKYN